MLFASSDLAYEKDRVEDQASDDERKKDYAENEKSDLGQIQQDPTDVECDRQNTEADAEHEKENCGLTAAHIN